MAKNCFLLVCCALACSIASGQYAEKAGDRAPAAVVWKLDSLESVGGYKTRLVGAPKVLATESGGPALRFDGTNDGVFLPVNPVANWRQFTIQVLFLPERDAPEAQRFVHIEDEKEGRVTVETRITGTNSWCLDTYLLCGGNGLPLCDRTRLHPLGKWTWAALVYDGKKMSSYVNGVKELEGEIKFSPMYPGHMSLGVRLNEVYWFKGSIKEVRFEPKELPAGALKR